MTKYHDPPGHIDWLWIILMVLWVALVAAAIAELFTPRWGMGLYFLFLVTLPVTLPSLLMWLTARSQRKHPERWY